jgi:hypothetical protein
MRKLLGLMGAAVLAAMMPVDAAAQTESVRLLGEVRVRGEAERQPGFDTTDAFTNLRSRIGLEAVLSPKAIVMLQVQDARTFGEEASLTDGSADRLDMHQAWLQYRMNAGEYGVSLRAGRQEIALGNERLVGASNWTATGRSFNGLRVTTGPATGGWKLNALAATVKERGRRLTGGSQEQGDHLFTGVHVNAGILDAFLLHDRETAYRVFTGVDRTTAGAAVSRALAAGVDASLEGFYQFGNQVLAGMNPLSQDISAYMFGARLGYVTPAAALPRLALGVDWLSGDDNPIDETYRAFNTLYHTGHKWYGYLDLFTDPAARTRDRGLIDGIASARVVLPRNLTLDVDAHGFWLQEQLPVAPDRFLGWEVDFTVPVNLGPGQLLHVGYSLFRNGAAAPLIGLGDDGKLWHWAYVQASFSFGKVSPIF